MDITVLQMKDFYESGVVSRESGDGKIIQIIKSFLWDREESGVLSQESGGEKLY